MKKAIYQICFCSIYSEVLLLILTLLFQYKSFIFNDSNLSKYRTTLSDITPIILLINTIVMALLLVVAAITKIIEKRNK